MFRVLGIQVYLHWSWFFAAAIFVQMRVTNTEDTATKALLDILTLFGIVLLHEFGHALACRSVGGEARTIVLWPLGGVAFVKPPPRPGPMLWSIAAGPLVNVVLIPVTYGLLLVLGVPFNPLDHCFPLGHWAANLFWVNLLILFFNMLPIYPLDGGQILQALLWFILGRSRSLKITASIGLAAAVLGGSLALYYRAGFFPVVMAVFIGWQAFKGFRAARMLGNEQLQSRGRSSDGASENPLRHV